MDERIELMPGVYLRSIQTDRFKTAVLSLTFLRPLHREENAANALLGNVLLRGTKRLGDLRQITLALDGLYGAGVGPAVLKNGQIQTVGLAASFMEDRFAMAGDRVRQPMLDLLRQLLLEPRMEGEAFCPEFVAGEKRNLISLIQSEINDKRVYAAGQLLRKMCSADAFGIPRLGTVEQVEAITPQNLYAHYQDILAHSQLEVFYCGSAPAEVMAGEVRLALEALPRGAVTPAAQARFCPEGPERYFEETMEVTQAKLSMGFTTEITTSDARFVPMMVCNTIFGAGLTSKLFQNVREKLSLCYSIGSSYYGAKGIVTVDAGIETAKYSEAREEILRQLKDCQAGRISREELQAAKEAIASSLQSVADAPERLESFYTNQYLSGANLSLESYRRKVEEVTVAQVVEAARTLELNTTFFLKGAEQCA